MSQPIDALLQQLEQLDAADRFVVEQRLHELAEADWNHEAEAARASARKRGIDQNTIDNAIEDLRYGS